VWACGMGLLCCGGVWGVGLGGGGGGGGGGGWGCWGGGGGGVGGVCGVGWGGGGGVGGGGGGLEEIRTLILSSNIGALVCQTERKPMKILNWLTCYVDGAPRIRGDGRNRTDPISEYPTMRLEGPKIPEGKARDIYERPSLLTCKEVFPGQKKGRSNGETQEPEPTTPSKGREQGKGSISTRGPRNAHFTNYLATRSRSKKTSQNLRLLGPESKWEKSRNIEYENDPGTLMPEGISVERKGIYKRKSLLSGITRSALSGRRFHALRRKKGRKARGGRAPEARRGRRGSIIKPRRIRRMRP